MFIGQINLITLLILTHIQTTSKEIWNQTAGKIIFICAVGTGGTLADFVRLKRKDKNIKIALSDQWVHLYIHIFLIKLKYRKFNYRRYWPGRITKNFEKLWMKPFK